MNFGALRSLNNVLQQLKSDTVTIALTLAGLAIVIAVIWIMFDSDTTVAAHTKRWEHLRKLFICAILLSSFGAIIAFGQQIGGAIHA